MKSFRPEKELCILIFLVIAFFYRPLFLGETFFYRDLYLLFFSQKEHLVNYFHSGELPLWDPYLHGGQAYFAEISNTVLQPSNLLYFFLTPINAFNVSIVLHVASCAVGMYFAVRAIGLNPLSALIAGMIYSFCGFTLSRINLLPGLFAMSYTPWIVGFWHLFITQKRKKWFAGTVIAGAFQLITGVLEISVLTFLFLLVYSLSLDTKRWLTIRLWVLAVAFVVGLSMIQLLPTTEIVLGASRGKGMSYGIFSQWSLHPKRLPEIIFPGFLGETDSLSNVNYWGRRLEPIYPPYILSIYFGIAAILLAIIGGFTSNGEVLTVKSRRWMMIFFGFFLLLALGSFLPFFEAVYRWVPFIKIVRFPVKFLAGAIVPVAILAAYASEVQFSVPTRRSVAAVSLAFVCLSILILSVYFFARISYAFESFFFGVDPNSIDNQKLLQSFLHAFWVCLVIVLLYYLRYTRRIRHYQWAIAALVVADLMTAGMSTNPYAPRSFFDWTPNIVPFVKKEIGDGRLYREPIHNRIKLSLPSNNIVWGYRWDLEVLRDYQGSSFEIPVIFHYDYDELEQSSVRKMSEEVDRLPWEKRLGLISAANVRLILAQEDISLPALQKIARIRNGSNLDLFLYRNMNTAPRVSFISRAIFVSSLEQALMAMKQPWFDPRTMVVLQQPLPNYKRRSCGSALLTQTESKFNRSSFSISNDCVGFLVFSEPFYPGWQTRLDGKRVEVIKANGIFSAIALKAGKHIVSREYVPYSLILGSAITIAFSILLALTRVVPKEN